VAKQQIDKAATAKKAGAQHAGKAKRSRKEFYRQAEAFFNLVEKAAGKPLDDSCVEWALKNYGKFVWGNQPKFVKATLAKKTAEKCCRDVGEAVKDKKGKEVQLYDFRRQCKIRERDMTAIRAVGGICS